MPRFWISTAATLAALLLITSSSFAQGVFQANPNGLCVHSILKAEVPTPDVWITLPGHHYLGSPTFSHDGEWIAFDAYVSGEGKVKSEVWIIKADGTEPRKLADGATPRWSPDGERLLFMREDRNADDVQLHGIYLIDREGTKEEFLCEGRWPDWSPDGTQIVYSKGTTDKRGGAQEFARIYIAKSDGSEPELIANGDCPAWSPDGKLIACSYRDPAFPAPMIRLIDVKGKRQKFLAYGWYRPNWSGDSQSVSINGPTPDRTIGPVQYSVAGESTAPKKLTDIAGAMSPCFSADGNLLVFAAPYSEE